MNKRYLYVPFFIITALLLIGSVYVYLHKTENASIVILDQFNDKIVYTTDMSKDKARYKEHCRDMGGIFNECGSPCPPGVDICADVCAYTCHDF